MSAPSALPSDRIAASLERMAKVLEAEHERENRREAEIMGTEDQPRIEVTVHWYRETGTFDSTVVGGNPAMVSVIVEDDGGILYGNDASDPDPEESDHDKLYRETGILLGQDEDEEGPPSDGGDPKAHRYNEP